MAINWRIPTHKHDKNLGNRNEGSDREKTTRLDGMNTAIHLSSIRMQQSTSHLSLARTHQIKASSDWWFLRNKSLVRRNNKHATICGRTASYRRRRQCWCRWCGSFRQHSSSGRRSGQSGAVVAVVEEPCERKTVWHVDKRNNNDLRRYNWTTGNLNDQSC